MANGSSCQNMNFVHAMPYFSRIERASKRQLMKSIAVCWVTQEAEGGEAW